VPPNTGSSGPFDKLKAGGGSAARDRGAICQKWRENGVSLASPAAAAESR